MRTFGATWQDAVGQVLFFEALPSEEAASRAVLEAACTWLRQQGCPDRLRDGVRHRRVTDRLHAGARGRFEEMVAASAARGVTMRPWRFDDVAAEAERFSRIYNATFGAHWGVPPFTVEDSHGLIADLADLMPEDFGVFADVAGETVGAVLSLPDVNQALHRLKTLAGPPGQEDMARALAAVDHGTLLSLSVVDSARGTGLNLGMAARAYLAMIARGYRSASYITVLDTNWPSRRTAEKLGGAHPPQLRRVPTATEVI